MSDFPLTIKYTKRKSSIALKIVAGEVIILAPKYTPKRFVDKLLKEKEAWISQKLQKAQSTKLTTAELYFYGKKYQLNFLPGKIEQIDFTKQQFTCFYKDQLPTGQQLNFLKETFLKNAASNYLIARVKNLAAQTNLLPNKIYVRNTKAQWGSCSRAKNISLSYKLICTSEAVIDYVIIHELCHLQEMNHSRKFWDLVFSFCPDYKQHIAWLKQHSFLLDNNYC